MPAKALALCCLLLFVPPLPADTISSDDAIDKHALAATDKDEASLIKLARYLRRPCKSDRDKARAVYCWITDRIAYDADAFFSRKRPDFRPPVVLQTRLAVCEGYAQLYVGLSTLMGLKAVQVKGYAKAPGYVPGQPLEKNEKHSWVAVSIKGRWQLIDPTWGAGHLKEKKFAKRFSDYYFLPDPDQLLFTHFPSGPAWQLVKKPLSASEFCRRPKVTLLFELGVSSKAVLAVIADKSFRDLVGSFTHPSTSTFIVDVPLSKYLTEGKEYEFRMRSDDYVDMGIVSNDKTLVLMKQDGKVFATRIKPVKGKLHVVGRKNKDDPTFSSVLGYEVE